MENATTTLLKDASIGAIMKLYIYYLSQKKKYMYIYI